MAHGIDKPQDSATPCAFRDLSIPCEQPEKPDSALEDACEQFQPLFNCDGSSSDRRQLKGKELADHLEEVQQRATQRGHEGGREEALRLAQASLLPHLRSVVDQLNLIVTQAQTIEESGSADSIALAMSIVKQVIGRPPSAYEIDEVKNALKKSISHTNRYQIMMNRDDLQYLQELMKDNRLTWPGHPSIDIGGDPTLERGQFHLNQLNENADEIDLQAADHMTAIFSQSSHQTT